jgi:diguanylate cyclase (GGDEF)-like protein/PAS domain S-box-containing protein
MNMSFRETISLEERVALFDYAFDNAPIGIAVVDTQGRILRGNASFSRMVGLSDSEVYLKAFRDFTHPDDVDADLTLFSEVMEGLRDGYTMEKRYIRRGGEIVYVRLNVVAMRNRTGKVTRFLSQIEDVSEQKRVELELSERAAQLELAITALRGGFWHMDLKTRVFETSDRLSQFIAGAGAERFDLDQYIARVLPEDILAADLTPLIAGEVDHSVVEYRLITENGERWMRCDRRLLRNSSGEPLRIVGVAIDMTEEHRKLESMQQNAETDALTGLLNRRGLRSSYEQMQSSEGLGLLVVDLDGFKQVNDRHGHPAGDAVLVEVGRRLSGLVRACDAVCRTGGDEFILIIAGPATVTEDIAARVVAGVRPPIAIGTGEVAVNVSIGGTWLSEKTGDIDGLIAMADKQLYAAKAAGKNTWRVASAV